MPASGDIVQIHTLTAHPAPLPVESGRIAFGGADRVRISCESLVARWGETARGDDATAADILAAVSVADAFTTHRSLALAPAEPAEAETEYAEPAESEPGSGVFYSYAVIDMERLRATLGERAAEAGPLARALVQAMATVSPAAEAEATAPNAYAELVLVERGAEPPRTLANAFLEPVDPARQRLMADSVAALVRYRDLMEVMYGDFAGEAELSTIHPVNPRSTLSPTALRKVMDRIFADASE